MKIDKAWFVWIILVSFVVGFMVGALILDAAGYKQGQTDALNGKWKYEYRADTLLYKIPQP